MFSAGRECLHSRLLRTKSPPRARKSLSSCSVGTRRRKTPRNLERWRSLRSGEIFPPFAKIEFSPSTPTAIPRGPAPDSLTGSNYLLISFTRICFHASRHRERISTSHLRAKPHALPARLYSVRDAGARSAHER